MKSCFFTLGAATILLLPVSVQAAGFATSANFTVFTPDLGSPAATQDYARQVLAAAEAYRKQVAREWFGDELPEGVGRTTINVSFGDPATDRGTTWPKDDPRRKLHVIYLTTNPEAALGNTLAHEIAHAVVATQFPASHPLAAWLDEGIASRYDDPSRHRAREKILAWQIRTGNLPSVRLLLSAESLNARDAESYALAGSLTEYLLTRGDRATLLEFGAGHGDWDTALARAYRIHNVEELETRWRQWLRGRGDVGASPPPQPQKPGPSQIGAEYE